jgi:hypothetical protein
MERLRAIRSWCEQHAAWLLFIVSLILIGGITLRGIDLRMDRIVPYRAPHHMYPIAISMLYHQGSPYLMYAEIQDGMKPMRCYITYDEIFSNSMNDHTAFNNALLAEMISTPIQRPDQTRLVPAEDKGFVDIVILALLLFGANVQGLYYTTILILLITVLTFFLAFRHRAEMCLAPVFVLGALYATMPGLLLTHEMYSLTNPRLFGILGVIPVIHLIFIFLDRQHFSWLRFGSAAFQVIVIVECIHVRSSTIWLVAAVAFAYLALLGGRFFRRQPASAWFTPDFRMALTSGWGVALLLCGVVGLNLYQRCAYDAGYSREKHRYCWHNIGIGMALHPKFAEKYELGINDWCMPAWVQQRISMERSEVIFGKPGEALERGAVSKDHQAYEAECCRAVVSGLVKNPWWTIELFFYYKPSLTISSFAWAAGLSSYDEKGLYLDTQRIALPDSSAVADQNLHIRLLELAMFSVSLVFLCVYLRIKPKVLMWGSLLSLWILLCSYIPSAIAYPVLHVIGDLLVCASICVLAVGVAISYAVVTRFFVAEQQPTPELPNSAGRLAA